MRAREFQARMIGFTAVFSLPTLLLIAGYLAAILRLSPTEWAGFVQLLLVLFPVLFAGVMLVNHWMFSSVVDCLRAEERGESGHQHVLAAFSSVANLHSTLFVSGSCWWVLGGILVAAGMTLRFETVNGFQAAVIVLAAATGGFISSVFMFFVAKAWFQNLRRELGRRLPMGERADRIRTVAVEWKLVVSVTGVMFLTVSFALLLALENTSRPVESHAIALQQRFLDERVGALERVDDAEAAILAREANAIGIATSVMVLDRETGEVVAGDEHALLPEHRAAIDRTLQSGDSSRSGSENVFAWRGTADGRRLVVTIQPWNLLVGDRSATWLRFGGTLLLAAGLAIGLARVLARDIAAPIRDLDEHAARVAGGDLRAFEVLESEDELGALSRSFAAMASSLGATVRRVAEAADGVETVAVETARVAEGAAGASRQQSAGVAETATTMDRIHQQATGIEGSAHNLGSLVEEAGSAVRELGSAGHQLAETASTLFEKIDEVSVSIERNHDGMRAVSENSASLLETAEETVVSMEQMASSMHHVRSAAAESAELSQHAVATAEQGRVRVLKTIESMQEIQVGITDAERVIRSLGDRAHEIGSIVTVIDDVAEESRLLALNAAIIAVQAGEHGRGFGVVAGQIKQLAARVVASTREIAERVNAVQQGSAAAIAAIGAGVQSAAAGVSLSEESGRALDDITHTARESGERIAHSASAVEEQTRATRHVAELMESVKARVEAIRHATDDQRRGNELILRSTLVMREIAQQVRATTDEHAKSCSCLHESIEGVHGSSDGILEMLRLQSSSCEEISFFLERLAEQGAGSAEHAERLERVTRDLLAQAGRLRGDVHGFQLEEGG